MKTLPIFTINGASVCTPDGFAMQARKRRLKRLLRSNLKSSYNQLHSEQGAFISAYQLNELHLHGA